MSNRQHPQHVRQAEGWLNVHAGGGRYKHARLHMHMTCHVGEWSGAPAGSEQLWPALR